MRNKVKKCLLKKEEPAPPSPPKLLCSVQSRDKLTKTEKDSLKYEPIEDPLKETTATSSPVEMAYLFEQRMSALAKMDLNKIFICCCPSSNSIFFSEEEYITHIFSSHGMHWFPNSSHLNKRQKTVINKYVDKELLTYFKQGQIKQMLGKLKKGCLQYPPLESLEIERRKEILKPLKYHKKDEGVLRNLNMNSLFYLQQLKKSKWIKKRLYDANYQYCTLCNQFIMYNHHREVNQPFIIAHMRKHRSNKTFKTTNLSTELAREIERMKKKKQQLFVCGCSSEKFAGARQFQSHIWKYHQGEAPKYSSHKLVEDRVERNTEFAQEKVLETCMLPELYICGFCFESCRGVIVFVSPTRYIAHMKQNHKVPYYHEYNSHFLKEYYKAEGQIFPIYAVQSPIIKVPNLDLVEEGLELLEKVERKFLEEEFRCGKCKQTFRTKGNFLECHERGLSKKEQGRHFGSAECAVILSGDNRRIVIPTNLVFISEAYQKKIVPDICGCQERSYEMKEFILHLKKKHANMLTIKNI